MNIIVVGCGKVGSSIAKALSKKHNLTVIDTNQELVSNISTSLDILGICGNGASYSVQEEAGLKDADLLIAVTPHDELNILCCLIAKKMANCKTIARIRNPIYKSELPYFKDELGLSMVINPEWTSAHEISRLIRFPEDIQVHSFANGGLELIEFQIRENSPLINKSLIEVGKEISKKVLVCAVQRNDKIYIPRGSFVLQENDVISIISKPIDSFNFFNKVKIKIQSAQNVLIIGGGKISYYLANDLNNLSFNTKIIEKDRQVCESLSESLPESTIIHADASNQDLLYSEGLPETNAFVSLTNIDEENIMLSLFAKKKSKAKIITKVNRIEFEKVLEEYDIGKIIHPKELAAEYISSYVEALEKSKDLDVDAMYTIVEGKAIAIEFIVKESDDFIINKELKTLKFKEGVLIASIKHENDIYMVNGSSVIRPFDSVVVVTRLNSVNTLKDILL